MTNTNELTAKLRAAAQKASGGDWIKESGDGWDAICSCDDQANGGFIIAHFEGPDAAANREFVQAANPTNILALTEALEAAEKRIAELEARTLTVKLPDGYAVRSGHPINEGERGVMIPKQGGDWLHRFDVEHALHLAGIKLQIEGD